MPCSRTGAAKGATVSPRNRRSFVSLRSDAEFRRVYREGARKRCGGLKVICAPGTPGPPQIGVVAGAGIGGAVVRNRAKRRIRAAAERIDLPTGVACILLATPEVLDAPFRRVVGWIEDGLAGAVT